MKQFAHVATEAAPIADEKVPATQEVQLDILPAPTVVEYVPWGQFMHVVIEVALTAVEYIPGTQPVHTDLPTRSVKVQASHDGHVDEPVRDEVPMGQRIHVDIDVAPIAVENIPPGQPVQSPAPITPENVPAGHLVHDVDPAREYIPMGQMEHVEINEAPTTVENVPAGQELQRDPRPTRFE